MIITGGAAGIGLAAAKLFAAQGANVLITGRRQDRLDDIARESPAIVGLVADAGDTDDAYRTIDFAIARWGRLDVIVNNAGAGVLAPLADVSIEAVINTFRVNVIGPTLMAKAALPHLARSHGSIINVSSTYGSKPAAGLSHYAASKAAVEHLTRCWALELASSGIRVNAIASGPVETAFLKVRMGLSEDAIKEVKAQETATIPLRRRGVPDDVAAWIIKLTDPGSDWVTGQVLAVDGGLAVT
ncbi:SDR family oxidoreductase [Mycolicibacterium cosmeticum]